MAAPLAYLITWTTYGSWLPGDARGWVEAGRFEIRAPDAARREESQHRMRDAEVTLDPAQRAVVEATVKAHCSFRGWRLHAVNARTDHVHVVVTAEIGPEGAMNQFKSWCSRRLNERWPGRKRWWTYHGSTKWIWDDAYFAEAVDYVTNRQ